MDLDEELAEFNREVRDKFQLLDYDVLEIGKGEAEQVEVDWKVVGKVVKRAA